MQNLLKALDAFQQEVPVIFKDTKAFNYNYADLPTILEIIKPLLKKNGLMFTQPLTMVDGVRGIRTIVAHVESGEILEGFVPVADVELKGQNDYQALGSGITYLRRYSLESVLGLVTSKDDDAGGASKNGANAGGGGAKSKLPKLTSRDQEKWPKAVAMANKDGHANQVLKYYSMIPADLSRLKKEAGLS